MASHLNIRYLKHNEIDIAKWNRCITQADNSFIYAYSWYLDHMSKHWDALVLGDYEVVMPLTWNRKYGIYYLYQPFLTPQLGISGKKITKEITEGFLQTIPGKFQFVEINLNTSNNFDVNGFQLKRGADYCLDLNRTYKTISSHYNENLKRNLMKAVTTGCEYRNNIPANDVLKLAKSQLVQYTRLQKDDISRFKKLTEYLRNQNSASAVGVYHNDELLSSCIFFFDAKRVYYILAGNDPKGKKIGTSHYLLDQFIRDHAGKNIVLDFVGSDFESIAQFYKSFGAEPGYYRSLKLNRLPNLVKWLKK